MNILFGFGIALIILGWILIILGAILKKFSNMIFVAFTLACLIVGTTCSFASSLTKLL